MEGKGSGHFEDPKMKLFKLLTKMEEGTKLDRARVQLGRVPGATPLASSVRLRPLGSGIGLVSL